MCLVCDLPMYIHCTNVGIPLGMNWKGLGNITYVIYDICMQSPRQTNKTVLVL